jgi:hypothetical protein
MQLFLLSDKEGCGSFGSLRDIQPLYFWIRDYIKKSSYEVLTIILTVELTYEQ